MSAATNQSETICAISTPPGVGGIATARVSGPQAVQIVSRIWKGRSIDTLESHRAVLGKIIDIERNQPLDTALLTLFRGPASFTGETVIEISVHGSKYIQRQLINSLILAGAKTAGHGEFTRRAFLNGKIDLTQAEAIADMIASDSFASHHIALNQMRGHFSNKLNQMRESLLDLASLLELELDFSEEEVEFASRQQLLTLANQIHDEATRLAQSFARGNVIKEGIPVAIAGPTNAGKSSLLNILLGDNKAIVSEIHGTTRDIIEDTIEIGDYRFRFMDTAGLRQTPDTIEQMGIDRSIQALNKSRIAILMLDSTQPVDLNFFQKVAPALSLPQQQTIIILNKTDIASSKEIDDAKNMLKKAITLLPYPENTRQLTISAKTADGIDQLRSTISSLVDKDNTSTENDILITNARHFQALTETARSAQSIIDGLKADVSGDFIAQDVRQTIASLGEITGEITSPEILTTIFSRFCIGK